VKVTPPCVEDFERTGRDWTALAPPRNRGELMEMARMCAGCPIKDQCREIAEEDSPYAEGVWGGMFYRNGRAIDPLGILNGNMESVYLRVHWDRSRGKWKAEAQVDGRKHHIGYFHDEDEAGQAAFAWQLADGD